jgi:glycerol kinase
VAKAIGFFQDTDELREKWAVGQIWKPRLEEAGREKMYRQWKKAVTRSFDWAE